MMFEGKEYIENVQGIDLYFTHILTPDEFKEKMIAISKTKDAELRHFAMDQVLCNLILNINKEYGPGINIFKTIEKYYA